MALLATRTIPAERSMIHSSFDTFKNETQVTVTVQELPSLHVAVIGAGSTGLLIAQALQKVRLFLSRCCLHIS